MNYFHYKKVAQLKQKTYFCVTAWDNAFYSFTNSQQTRIEKDFYIYWVLIPNLTVNQQLVNDLWMSNVSITIFFHGQMSLSEQIEIARSQIRWIRKIVESQNAIFGHKIRY